MKALALSLLFLAISTATPAATETDYAATTTEQLIDDLVLIDTPAPGIDGDAWFTAFMADNKPAEFAGGIIGSPSPQIPPPMRELVRRGLRAVPDLIQHLQDNRPTKLSIHTNFFEGSHFSDEYDPRTRPPPTPKAGCAQSCLDEIFGTKPIYDPYVVKVGDVCYVLIGQIVNRNLVAVRYQPSAMVIVNSPLEAPDLIERVTSDWSGLDARSHEASLLADIRAGDNIRLFGPALARLRFYYAGAYQSLRDEDRKKREAFEAQEKARDTAN